MTEEGGFLIMRLGFFDYFFFSYPLFPFFCETSAYAYSELNDVVMNQRPS
jgi:hypothetical protein